MSFSYEVAIKANKLLIQRLGTPKRTLQRAVERKTKQAEKKHKKWEDIGSKQEAQDAWGYGAISEPEYLEILDYFDNLQDHKSKAVEVEEFALDILGNFMTELHEETRYLEQDRIRHEKRKEIQEGKNV